MGGKRLISRGRSPPNSEAPTWALRSAVTSSSSFFVRSHFSIPKVDSRTWRLTVGGQVRSPRELTYGDLRRMRRVSVAATLECAGNGRSGFRTHAKGELVWGTGAVSTGKWSGVALRDLLESAGVLEGASEVVAEGLDEGTVSASPRPFRFSRALPIEKAMSGETLVALEMNGRRLTPEHGFPARLVVPGWYGMASVKWLDSIRVVSGAPYRAFFNGSRYTYLYTKDGKAVDEPVTEVRVKSLITAPVGGETLPMGAAITVRGMAWSGTGRIASVEVDTGEGWTEARLGTPRLGRFAWVPWSKRWLPRKRGRATISARATDERGNTQPPEPFENRYQYGYNAAQRVSVKVG